ncbi:hypothetical protein [Sulfurimonas sp.]|uniref:hypothetical protein n=1 Tax=Sulfurimonas sp. TaxID=2022749 RepID=UPI0035654E54
MKKIVLVSSALVMALTFSGCSQHMGNFTAMSTDAYNPENIKNSHKVKTNVDTNVASTIILGIPIGGRTKLDQAVSETAHKNGGDFLKNAQVHAYGWYFLLFGQQGYKIKADVYNTQE